MRWSGSVHGARPRRSLRGGVQHLCAGLPRPGAGRKPRPNPSARDDEEGGGRRDEASPPFPPHTHPSLTRAVLLAEVVHHYYPKLVEIHNYSGANSVRQKMYNWATLNQKVFRRLGFPLEKGEIEAAVNCKPGAIELLLMRLQKHIAEMRRTATSPAGLTPAGAPGGLPALTDGHAFDQPQFGSGPAAPAGHHAAPAAAAASHRSAASSSVEAVEAAIIVEKDSTIGELRETIEILELKIKKLEQVSVGVWIGEGD